MHHRLNQWQNVYVVYYHSSPIPQTTMRKQNPKQHAMQAHLVFVAAPLLPLLAPSALAVQKQAQRSLCHTQAQGSRSSYCFLVRNHIPNCSTHHCGANIYAVKRA